jgi:hypothetical protein
VICGFGGEGEHGCKEMLAAKETGLQKTAVSDERGRACLLLPLSDLLSSRGTQRKRVPCWSLYICFDAASIAVAAKETYMYTVVFVHSIAGLV